MKPARGIHGENTSVRGRDERHARRNQLNDQIKVVAASYLKGSFVV